MERNVHKILGMLGPMTKWRKPELSSHHHARSCSYAKAVEQLSRGPWWAIDVGPIELLLSKQEAVNLREWFRDQRIDFVDRVRH